MRIAFLSFYSGLVSRGAETVVTELATQLSRSHQVEIYQGGPAKSSKIKHIRIPVKQLPEKLETANFLRRLFITPRQLQELRFYLRCISKLKKGKYDIVIPMNSGLHIPILKLLSKIYGFKLVISGQSGPGWDDLWNLLWRPDLFVCLTNTRAQWVRSFRKDQKIVVIPNGVDLSKFSNIGKKIKLKLSHPVVLVVAASIPSKRLTSTIEAVGLTKASLLIVGSGYLDREIDQLGKTILKNRYLHLSLNHSQMPQAYRSANIFTLCSDSSEAFGIAYLEALATGLPIVATDDNLRREIVGPTGIYVKNPTNATEYARAITKALSLKSKTNSADRTKSYSWERIGLLYHKALTSLLIR